MPIHAQDLESLDSMVELMVWTSDLMISGPRPHVLDLDLMVWTSDLMISDGLMVITPVSTRNGQFGHGPYREYFDRVLDCLLYTSPSPRDKRQSRMPSSA